MFVEIRVCNYKKKAQLIAPRTLNSLYFNLVLIQANKVRNDLGITICFVWNRYVVLQN